MCTIIEITLYFQQCKIFTFLLMVLNLFQTLHMYLYNLRKKNVKVTAIERYKIA